MLCARVMRGTSSTASAVTRFAARARTRSGNLPGCMKATTIAPGRSAAISDSVGTCTLNTTSPCERVSSVDAAIVAPSCASSKPALAPTPACATMMAPSFCSFFATSGWIAARLSPGALSFGTAMRTAMTSSLDQAGHSNRWSRRFLDLKRQMARRLEAQQRTGKPLADAEHLEELAHVLGRDEAAHRARRLQPRERHRGIRRRDHHCEAARDEEVGLRREAEHLGIRLLRGARHRREIDVRRDVLQARPEERIAVHAMAVVAAQG